MSSDYTDLSPYQRVGSAWNEISNAQQDIPPQFHGRVTAILGLMDLLLLDLHPSQTIEPIPLCADSCRHCGGRRA